LSGLFIESHLSDTNNIVSFENTISINRKNVKIKEHRSDWLHILGVWQNAHEYIRQLANM